MAKAPTIIDVARRAKLSMKTVSRVFNDEPHVSAKARTRVLEAAKALDYRPNMFARSLAGTRSYLIGLVYARPSPAYVMTIQEGVLEQCEASGYNLLIRPYDPDANDVVRSVLGLVERSRVDGLIVIPPLSDNAALTKALLDNGVAHVRVSQSRHTPDSDRVGTDETGISYELTKYLLSLGHERIAIVKGHPLHGGSEDRLQGYLRAMGEAGIEPPAIFIQQGLFTFESGVECGRRLLGHERRPTAIFASNDYMAAGVVNAAHRRGLQIPTDLSVAGFDDAPVSRQIWPGLTTVRQPVADLARSATKRLVDKIAKGTVEESAAPLKCEIVVRESTGCHAPARVR